MTACQLRALPPSFFIGTQWWHMFVNFVHAPSPCLLLPHALDVCTCVFASRYITVLDACALLKDIQSFAAGDASIIGAPFLFSNIDRSLSMGYTGEMGTERGLGQVDTHWDPMGAGGGRGPNFAAQLTARGGWVRGGMGRRTWGCVTCCSMRCDPPPVHLMLDEL